jgi:hypothetical protein
MIDVAPVRRRAGSWRRRGQEIACGAGQAHYSIGVTCRFTCGNLFRIYVGKSNTSFPDMHIFTSECHAHIVISIS